MYVAWKILQKSQVSDQRKQVRKYQRKKEVFVINTPRQWDSFYKRYILDRKVKVNMMYTYTTI